LRATPLDSRSVHYNVGPRYLEKRSCADICPIFSDAN
jgi:hypothetical protein